MAVSRTRLAGVCPLHGPFDGARCPSCAGLVDLPAIRQHLHEQSVRLDRAHEATMGLGQQLADLRAYAESLERLLAAQQARLTEMEQWRSNFNYRLKLLEPCDGL